MAHEKDFFINLDHAIEQFRSRAKVPSHWTNSRIEREMRTALERAQKNNAFILSRFDGEKLCRIALPNLDVVYAILEPGRPDGQYKWMIHTVFTQEMYHSWSKDGRLGTLGEKIDEKDQKKLRETVAHPKKEI